MATTGFAITSNRDHRAYLRAAEPYQRWPVLKVIRPSEAGMAMLELGAEVTEAIELESSDYLTDRQRESAVLDRAEDALRIEMGRCRTRLEFLELLSKAGA